MLMISDYANDYVSNNDDVVDDAVVVPDDDVYDDC